MRNLPLVNLRHYCIFAFPIACSMIFFDILANARSFFFSHLSWMACLVSICLFCSCAPIKNSVYFENLKKDTTLHNLVSKDLEPKIQKGDILGISVASLSPDVAFYNNASVQAASASPALGSASSASGYLVDKDGNVNFIKIGTVHAEGLTKKELKSYIEKGLIPYLKDVIVNISFLNRHITMLGAVTSQVLPLVNENMTILDALAASGDIGQKGKIDNILVIREKDSVKEFKRVSLKDNSIFYSPYFYLQPNDVVYVEPAKIKTPIQTGQLISYIISGISIIFIIINNLLK